MSFYDLPPTWTDQPLSDPARAADVIDLMVSIGDRRRGTFAVVLCDPDDRYRATLSIELPPEFDHLEPEPATAGVCSSALAPILPAVRTAPGTALILALGRPGPPFRPELDTEWAEAATRICHAADVRLLGFYVASAEHIYQPQLQAPAAAA